MSKFYRAPNKRLIARGGGGRFRETSLADIGMAECSQCGAIFTPDYSSLGEIPDPRVIRDLQKLCSECSKIKEAQDGMDK